MKKIILILTLLAGNRVFAQAQQGINNPLRESPKIHYRYIYKARNKKRGNWENFQTSMSNAIKDGSFWVEEKWRKYWPIVKRGTKVEWGRVKSTWQYWVGLHKQ